MDKPAIRSSATGQFSARGTLTAKLLRKAYGRATPAALPPTSRMFADGRSLLEFEAAAFTADKIDTVNAIIRGVSVITQGVIARGHDLAVDETTLSQMKHCGDTRGQVPVKVDHKSGAASVCGYLENFYPQDGKLKADWHLLQTHPLKEQILETAARMPRGVGLSAAFVGPDKPERTKDGKKAARCEELVSVDYVTLPAANPNGMFSAKVDSPQVAMNPELLAAIQAAVAEAVAPLSKQIDLLKNPPTLEEIAQMDDAQLAELGITPEEVAAALDEYAQSQEVAGEIVDPNAPAEVAEPVAAGTAPVAPAAPAPVAAAPAAPASTGFEALTKLVTELSAKIDGVLTPQLTEKEQTQFAEIEAKVDALTKENASLKQAMKTSGRPATAGVDRGGVRHFSRDAATGEFENLVQLGIEEKKLTKSKAMEFARKENPAAYENYLVRLGVKAPVTV
jgi:hypothetical protein